MPSAAFVQLFERIFSDDAFLSRLVAEQGKALDEYQLAAEERSALLSGDADRVLELGVDERVSKHFRSSGGGALPPY